ncbi:MAG TPA: ZIP family metal transporter [Methylophaga sp.]|nr:ZIP family metal transporter [Methylophaga sp.]
MQQGAVKQSVTNLLSSWRAQMQTRPWITLSLATVIGAMLFMLIANLLTAFNRVEPLFLQWALIGGAVGAASTALGAAPGLFIKNLPIKIEDTMLGMAAGMMLAASFFSLILPGIEAGTLIAGNATSGVLVVIFGMIGGVLLMLGLDYYLPHEHAHSGPCGAGYQQVSRVSLFVLAIALHNFPEGMAIGVGYTNGNLSVGIPLTAAIAIQNIPEGLAVVLALKRINMPVGKAVLIAAMTGLVEPIGAVLGIFLSSGLPVSYPLGLGIAAGAMIFVVSHEVIPETHRNGHQTTATIGLMGGFFIIMLLTTLLG